MMNQIAQHRACRAGKRTERPDSVHHRRRSGARQHACRPCTHWPQRGRRDRARRCPFSDPMADGPVIQRSSRRALAKGMSLRKVLADRQRIPQDEQQDAGGADGLR